MTPEKALKLSRALKAFEAAISEQLLEIQLGDKPTSYVDTRAAQYARNTDCQKELEEVYHWFNWNTIPSVIRRKR